MVVVTNNGNAEGFIVVGNEPARNKWLVSIWQEISQQNLQATANTFNIRGQTSQSALSVWNEGSDRALTVGNGDLIK